MAGAYTSIFVRFLVFYLRAINVQSLHQTLPEQKPLGGVSDAGPEYLGQDANSGLDSDVAGTGEDANEHLWNPDPESSAAALNAPPVAPPFIHGITECFDWLKKINGSIQYRFRLNETHADNLDLLECLRTPEAADARRNITEIFAVFQLFGPPFGKPSSYSDILVDVVELLTNFQQFKFPCSMIWNYWEYDKWTTPVRDTYKGKQFGDCYYYNERNIEQFPECDETEIDPSLSALQHPREPILSNKYNTYFSPAKYDAALKVLKTCPTVKTLYDGFWGSNAPAFNFTDPDQMVASPQRVYMTSFNWSAPGYDGKNQAQTWASRMDWSQVEELELSRYVDFFVEAFVGKLPHLTTLNIHAIQQWQVDEFGNFAQTNCSDTETLKSKLSQQSGWEIWRDFAESLSPLRTLELFDLENNTDAFNSALEQSRFHLEDLRIHNTEASPYACPTEVWTWKGATLDDLRHMQETIPYLKTLVIDIEHEGQIPYESLEVIGKWPLLEKVIIYLSPVNSWAYDEDKEVKRFMFNRTTVYSIFETYFYAVEKLIIYVGEPPYNGLEVYGQKYGTVGATYVCYIHQGDGVKERLCEAHSRQFDYRGPGKWQDEGWRESEIPMH